MTAPPSQAGAAYRVGLTGGLAGGKSTAARRLAAADGFVVVDADRLVADLYRPGQPGAAAVRDLFGPAVLTPEGAVDHAAVAARIFADAAARRALEQAIHPLVRRRFEDLVQNLESGTPDPGLAAVRVTGTAVPGAAQPGTTLPDAGATSAAHPAAGTGAPFATHPAAGTGDTGAPSVTSPAADTDGTEVPAPVGSILGAGDAGAASTVGAADRCGAAPRLPPDPPAVVVLEATLLVEAGYRPGFDLIVTIEADAEERLRRAVARGLPEPAARARLAAQGDGAARRRGADRVIANDGSLADLNRQIDRLIADLRDAAAAPGHRQSAAGGRPDDPGQPQPESGQSR